MSRCSAAPIRLFTIINKVIGTCDNLQERSYDSRISKERQEDETKDREEFARNSANVYHLRRVKPPALATDTYTQILNLAYLSRGTGDSVPSRGSGVPPNPPNIIPPPSTPH